MNFYEKVIKLQAELSVPKNQRNKFGNYNYRSCEDIVEATKKKINELDLGLLLIVTDNLVLIGERYYIEATAKLTDGEAILESNGYAREADNKKGMDSSQLTGATSSYARKYALNGLLAIDDTKDADDTNKHGKADKKPATTTSTKSTGKISDGQVKFIHSLLNKYNDSEKAKQSLYKKYNVESVKDLTKSQASEAIKKMNGGK